MNEQLARLRISDAVHVGEVRGASDVHLTPGRPPSIRVDGNLEAVTGPSLTATDTASMAGAIFDGCDVRRIQEGRDVSIACEQLGNALVRVHGFRSAGGITLALRLLPRKVPSFSSLGLPASIAQLAERRHGLIILAGTTGSGKSTTMAAIVDRINRQSGRRIITIEDPIEYRHVGVKSLIDQREIGRDARSFGSAIRGALRADPDVIVVGEMRDRSTMRAAIGAAETGHLVLSTLHTGDVAQTIDRILHPFSAAEQEHVRAQLSQVLVAIVCQRLIRRARGAGRRPIAEILILTDAARHIIRDARTHQLPNLMMTGRAYGMQTFKSHMEQLAADGEIDRELAQIEQ